MNALLNTLSNPVAFAASKQGVARIPAGLSAPKGVPAIGQSGTGEPAEGTNASVRRGADSVAISSAAAAAEAADAELAADSSADPANDPAADPAAPKGTDGEPLDEGEQKQVETLEARDQEVRTHEQAHKSAAGPYATSGPNYEYEEGPDGKRYAVGGSVGIDVAPEGTPEETIKKMRVVRRAALAPAEPSGQDRKVAAQASQTEREARAELAQERARVREEDAADGSGDTVGSEKTGAASDASSGLEGASPQSTGEITRKLEAFRPPTFPTFEAVA